MSEQRQVIHYKVIRGFPFPAAERFTDKNIEDAMDLIPADGDIVTASYPKTGTTWMGYIVLQIISKGQLFPTFDDVVYKIVPFVEMVGVAAVHAQNKPRIYKHHIAYNMVQKSDTSKCIYTYRNPEDTVVSYYHFFRNLNDYETTFDFDLFFDIFLTGKIAYGNYFEHVLSFYERRADDNMLLVSYEKLQANRRDEILRIAKFLGEEHHRSLLEDKDLLDKIIEHTTFDYMKRNLHLTHPDIPTGVKTCKAEDKPKVEFFRKGIVGDGKNVLTCSQRQRLKDAAEKVLKGTSIMDEWYPE